MIVQEDDEQRSKLIKKIFIKLAFGSVYFDKVKCDNNKIVQINV